MNTTVIILFLGSPCWKINLEKEREALRRMWKKGEDLETAGEMEKRGFCFEDNGKMKRGGKWKAGFKHENKQAKYGEERKRGLLNYFC